ncbi:hypothetical protein [Alkaliflexus imshenetskii]|uniref:hypothetical protein n=1 Tax=Alkaliflexus imshenetskii TaxID=286730 RepID=UPI0012F99B56|nr:hypothetical protein [Alkaliflexus imshenetskii]
MKNYLFLIVFVSCIIFIASCSEDKFSDDYFDNISNNEFLSIDDDLHDLRVLVDIEKVAILKKATDRVYEHVKLVDGYLFLNLNANQLSINDNLFDYITYNIKNTNKDVKSGRLRISLDDKGMLIFEVTERNDLLRNLVRLKSGTTESSGEKVSLKNSSDQTILNKILQLFREKKEVKLTEAFDTTDGWDPRGWFQYKEGTAYVNGKLCKYRILNNCTNSGDDSCGNNTLTRYDSYSYSNGNVEKVTIMRNSRGEPVITITEYR